MTDALAPTELGQLLEKARVKAGISGREAARRSRFSPTRWRQLIQEPRPPRRTIVAAALGVGVDPALALETAGQPADPEEVEALVAEAKRAPEVPEARRARPVTGLADEIERIKALPLPAEERLRVAQGVIGLYEDLAREQDEPAENSS